VVRCLRDERREIHECRSSRKSFLLDVSVSFLSRSPSRTVPNSPILSLSKTLTSSLPSDFPHSAPSPSDQLERSTWPTLKSFLTSAFLLKTRQEWTSIFIGTESCCVPVLSKEEVDSEGRGIGEPGMSLNEEEAEGGGVPSPAPRLSRTPSKAEGKIDGVFLEPGKDTRDVLREAGLENELAKLVKAGAISAGEDEPVKSKL